QFALGSASAIGDFIAGRQFVQREFVGWGEDRLAALHEADIAGDAEYPGANPLRLAQLVEALERLQQRLLGDLLGVFRAAAHHPAIVEHLPPEMLDEPFEGVSLPSEQRAGQFGFTQLVHAPIVAPSYAGSSLVLSLRAGQSRSAP